MKINPKYGEKIIALPSSQVLSHIKDASADQLRVLIFALSEQNTTAEEIERATGVDAASAKEALRFWKSAGAISVTGLRSAPPAKEESPKPDAVDDAGQRRIIFADKLPRYTEEEVAKKLVEYPELHNLIDECCDILGTVLNETEAGDIVVLYHYLGLKEDYIMLLCSHCAASGKTKLPYIKKVAEGLFNEGVTTYAELERYYESIESAKGIEGKVRGLFGIGSRRLVAAEKEAVALWAAWDISDELLEKAYDATVKGADKPSINYMHAVIKRWHDNGLDTPEKVDRASDEYKKSAGGRRPAKKGAAGAGSFDAGDFFEAALQRSYGGKNNTEDTAK